MIEREESGKITFFSSTLHPASFYHDLWDDLWCQESSSSCHDHTRARFSHQQQQPPLPCNYGRWLGAQFLCKKKSFPNYARTKHCTCNSEVISSVKAKLEMTKYFHLQMGLFFDSCKLWKTVLIISFVKVKRKSSEVCATILLIGSV